MEQIRWGILSTGGIAANFARSLRDVPDAVLLAVGSRTQAAAERFGREFDIPRRYASYEALAADPELDAIYIATPHPLHAPNMRLCLEAGKAVLCEKPFTVNAAEARACVALARARGLFLMEAMWTRFRPHMVELRRLLAEGAIGEPRMLHAQFGFRMPFDPSHRVFDVALGGGAMLDLGVYPISLAHMIFGTPAQVTGLAHLGPTGADEQLGAVLKFAAGRLALIAAASRTSLPFSATLAGTEGQIELGSPWVPPSHLVLRRGDAETRIDPLEPRHGFSYQVQEVHACLRAGRTESAILPLDESIAVMETMDALRAPWGLRYPGE